LVENVVGSVDGKVEKERDGDGEGESVIETTDPVEGETVVGHFPFPFPFCDRAFPFPLPLP